MIAVIFEVEPAGEAGMQDYLRRAAGLSGRLAGLDGFVSVERFQSLARPAKLLSLSFFQDEAAVRAWRETPDHRLAQAAGRAGTFRDYRLRVAQVQRDYGLAERDQAPLDSRSHHQG